MTAVSNTREVCLYHTDPDASALSRKPQELLQQWALSGQDLMIYPNGLLNFVPHPPLE